MKKAKALWHLSPSESQLLEANLGTTKSAALDIATLYSLVSSGTERLVANGQVPEELALAMQVPGQEGSFDFPIKYGYSLVGKVMNKGHQLEGQRIHLLHPHQDFCQVEETSVFVIPESVPPLRATLASNLETAVNAVWDAGVQVGDRVLVAGFGIIGALTAQVLSGIPAIDLWVLEKDAARQKMLQEMGFKLLNPEEKNDPFDRAFHSTGQEEGLQFCIDHIGFGGKVVELSWYGQKKIQLHLGGSFHSERKQIISSQVGRLPADRRDRWDFYRRKQIVFELLKDSVFDQYINRVIPFAQSPDFFGELRKGRLAELGVCIEY